MATQPPRRVVQPFVSPQHYVPPGARELRAQAVQRLQSGLFGIAAIILVVGLASIINDRARLAEGGSQPQSAASISSAAKSNSDPLAEAGVVPSSAPDLPAVTAPAAASPTAGAPRPAPAGQTN